MQKKYSYLMLALLLLLLGLPTYAVAQDDNTVLQPQFGKQTVTVATGQEITFYDFKGTGSISSSSSSNSQSLTVFKPAEAGMSIQITFETFDVRNEGKGWWGQARIYDGEVDDSNFTWATTTSGVTAQSTLPDGNVLDTLDGTYTDKTYYSSATDGALSVGFLYRYAQACDGWVAKVKCVKLENMTVTGAGSQYGNVLALPKSKSNVNLAGLYVTTEGITNADHLKTVSFTLAKNENNTIDPLTLKLYKGSEASYIGGTPIDATISQDGGNYTFALDQTLESGNNPFTIVGNIMGNEVGSKVLLNVTGVTTTSQPDGVSPFTAAEAVEVENPAVVTIAATEQTITVGDTPLNFYDDGGSDGQISKDLKSAKITFTPATVGKKIMIDFTKMALATGSIYNQNLKVYNGTETTDDNLLKTILGTETARVRSTAADGSLTVVFTSNAYNTADGWEATVTQFTPQPMTVSSIEATQITGTTVSCGDTGQPILKLNIKTENTEPLLAPKKFAFTTNGTFAQVTKATLYYTKSSDTFSTKTKLGETDVTADAFEITTTDEVSFVEGDNYLWLAYDINNLVENGQKVDAAITTATFSDGAHAVANGNPEGYREVLNQVLSHLDQGTVTTRVNNSIAFKTKNKNDYSSDYESGNDDRINIFEPLHEGMTCQIDFSKFDLYYASYGSDHATMKIYSGKGTTGEMLWECTKDTKATGPGATLRSTSDDGALTIVFNSGVSSSWSTTTGFEATVSEYKPQPMAVESVDATQASTQAVQIGAKAQDILNANIHTKGAKDRKQLTSVQIAIKGCQTSVDAVKLYSIDKESDTVDPDAEPLATAMVKATDERTMLTLATPVELKEGDNFFRIQFDISADAKAETIIDASLVGVGIDGESVAATNGDPDGYRVVKNIYILSEGDNGEVLVAGDAPLMFYDDGGMDGDYTAGQTSTVTFAPKTEGESVKLTFKEFNVTAEDKLYIYDGGEVKETADATYSMYDKPTYFLSNSADGKVTVRFVTKYSKSGFAIEVSAYKKQPIHVASVSATSVAPENTMKGAEAQMLKIAVEADGDLDKLDIQKFALAGTDLADNAMSRAKVYATGTNDTFSPAHLFGETSNGQLTIDGSYKITVPGTYYFWLTAMIDASAAEGTTAAASLESMTANGTTTAVTEPALATTIVKKGISGTITVGASADYGTIQGAIDALKGGIDGPVVINIKRGIYNENVTVPEIPGASEHNTVTLQSESGNWHDVKIYYDQYNEPAYSDDKMAAEFGVFTVAGANWFTLRGVELTTTDLSFPGVIHIKNQSRHVTIDSCYVHTDISVDYQNDINLVYTYAKNVANQNNDYLTIRNSLLEGGYIGIRMGGTGTVALPKEVGGIIENNTLRNQGTKAIYCIDELGAKIRGNVIENTLTTKEFYGFDGQLRDDYPESFTIEGNKFKMAIDKAAYPISLRTMKGTEEAPAIIANNEIIVTSDNSSSFGIKLGSESANVNIAYNTVCLNGNATSAAMYINDANLQNVNIVNNIFMNNAGGYAYRYYKADCVALPTYAHNVAYTTGRVFAYDKTDIATYDDWKTVSNETDGLNENVSFYDTADCLEPSAKGNLCTAQYLPYVTTDITGAKRKATTPTIGAYEYDAYTEAPTMADGYPQLGNIADTSVDATVMFDQTGVAQFVAKLASEPAATIDEVTASDVAVSVYKNKALTATVDGLEKDKEYIIYTALTSLSGLSSEVYASSKFVAGGEIMNEMPNVKVAASATESVEAGDNAELKATVSDGTAPFSIVWTNGKHEQIATTSLDDFGTATSEYAPSECDFYYVTVVDANGKQASDTCRVYVTGDAVTATFENLYLNEESFWSGPDTKGTVGEAWGMTQYTGSFVSGSYEFGNSNIPAYASWSGFAYSNRTATSFVMTTPDQYNSAVGHGYDDSENYAVAYNAGTIKVLNNPVEGDSIRGVYVTNEAWALECIKNGSGQARKFTDGDYLKLTFTGTKADGTTSSVDYYLADYRQTKAADHYYLDTWQWVDLRPLGKVKSVEFSLSGSDSGKYGLNTSAYFCLDNFNGERSVEDAPVQTSGETVDLGKFLSFDDLAATVTYAFADELSDEQKQNITLSADGKLTVKSGYNGQFNVVISATQKGKIQFIRVPFDIATGIDGITDDSTSDVKARYNVGGQKIEGSQRGINIVRTTDGKTRKVIVK